MWGIGRYETLRVQDVGSTPGGYCVGASVQFFFLPLDGAGENYFSLIYEHPNFKTDIYLKCLKPIPT